ncbi:dna-directed rna polymerase ii subunit rpb9 [Trichoderma arundinaceum]|uniref:Dna-directed rna polymerase ii subunit rpb9 n=1 Tax=Trichoderma arundinaceum TaxID=490622 RepID=A0A395NI63_TRIAR|nr:dna-directed rna polymerase ii subunit rpb9 [Trichoderma arundinaceum]
MATPQSTASYEASGPKKLEQITFRFCSECSNMLYPKEDEDAHKLQFTCRTCQYTEDAQSTCVFRNVLNNSSGETAGVTQDVGSDPTVSTCHSVPVLCLRCGCLVRCDTCGEPTTELSVARSPDEAHDYLLASVGLHQFSLPFPADPFEEYDEELMEDAESTGDSDMSDFSAHDSSESEEYCEDAAMIVDA